MMLRDGSEKGKNGEVRCTKIPFTKVRENERKKAADSLLVSDLGLSRDLVQSEMLRVRLQLCVAGLESKQ